MKVLRDPTTLPPEVRGGAVAAGNFDGVHLGHARMVERLVAHARRLGRSAVALTFDPHPVSLLRPEHCPPLLTWIERRAELLGELGVDAVVVWPTDREFLCRTPREFFDSVIRRTLDAKALVEGANFFFGRDRAGTIDVLAVLASESGIELEVVPPVEVDGSPVSSSRIRGLILDGKVVEAARLLGRPHRLRGRVVAGAKRGAGLGFPTANLDQIDTVVPGLGVYAGVARVADARHPAAINVGPNPTFGESQRKLEVHLLDFDGDLYGRELQIDFAVRLRDISRFASIDELRAQLARDVAAARESTRHIP